MIGPNPKEVHVNAKVHFDPAQQRHRQAYRYRELSVTETETSPLTVADFSSHHFGRVGIKIMAMRFDGAAGSGLVISDFATGV